MENLGKKLTDFLNAKNLSNDYKKLMTKAINDTDVQAFLKENGDKINNDAIDVSASSIYEFYNHKVHNSELSNGYFPKLIVSNHNIEVVYVPNERTRNKKKQSEYESSFRLIDMPKSIRNASFANFDNSTGERGRMDAFSYAIRFSNEYVKSKKFTPGLYLAGDYGVGKTYLLGAIANELFTSKSVKSTMIHFPSFAVEIKESISDNSVISQVNKIKSADILMIDDIGADSMSGWIRDEILGVILQYRMQNDLPTFFSSNFSMDQLQDQLAKSQRGELEPIKAQRIMERIKYLSKEVIMTGPNKRFQR